MAALPQRVLLRLRGLLVPRSLLARATPPLRLQQAAAAVPHANTSFKKHSLYFCGELGMMTAEQEQILQELYRIRENIGSYTDYEELIKSLGPLLPSVPIAMDGFANQPYYLDWNSQFNYIYRARVIEENGKRWDQESEISYLPDHVLHLAKAGRANRIKDRVYYGSVHPISAMIETYSSGPHMERVVSGKTLECVIGMWEVVQPITFTMLPFSIENVEKVIARRTFTPDKYNPVTTENAQVEGNHMKAMINNEFAYKILEFFSDAFAFPGEEQYMLSTYYAERVLNKVLGFRTTTMDGGGPIEGIFFNAIASSYEIRNVILQPHVVDAKLRLRNAFHYLTKFDKEHPMPFFLPIESYAPVRDGVIQWRKPYP